MLSLGCLAETCLVARPICSATPSSSAATPLLQQRATECHKSEPSKTTWLTPLMPLHASPPSPSSYFDSTSPVQPPERPGEDGVAPACGECAAEHDPGGDRGRSYRVPTQPQPPAPVTPPHSALRRRRAALPPLVKHLWSRLLGAVYSPVAGAVVLAGGSSFFVSSSFLTAQLYELMWPSALTKARESSDEIW